MARSTLQPSQPQSGGSCRWLCKAPHCPRLARRLRRISSRIRQAAPTLMADVGHVEGREVAAAPVESPENPPRSRACRRSTTLPMAPPRMLASAKQNSFCVGCLRSCQMIKHGGHHANAHKQPALPAAVVGQEAEGRTRVVRAHDVEEAGDRGPVAQLVVAQDPLSWSTGRGNTASAQASQGQSAAGAKREGGVSSKSNIAACALQWLSGGLCLKPTDASARQLLLYQTPPSSARQV